jgi:hypothetical protein
VVKHFARASSAVVIFETAAAKRLCCMISATSIESMSR